MASDDGGIGMGKRGLTTPQRRLKLALEARGWRIQEVLDENLPWWTYEVWVLVSTWSPTGTRLLLTFVLDPLYETGSMRGRLARAVVSWGELTSYRCEGYLAGMTMRHGWERELGPFLQALDDVRAERAHTPIESPPN